MPKPTASGRRSPTATPRDTPRAARVALARTLMDLRASARRGRLMTLPNLLRLHGRRRWSLVGQSVSPTDAARLIALHAALRRRHH